MKTFIVTVVSRDPNQTGYIKLADFALFNNISGRLTRLLHENFNTVPDPGIGVPSMMIYTIDGENIVSLVCASTVLLGLSGELIEKYKDTNCAYIYYVCTDVRYRGNGYGKTLVKKMIDLYRQKNIEIILIDVAVNNEIAYGLYKSLGFHKVASMIEQGVDYDILLKRLIPCDPLTEQS
jgi:ribosomal protein S18 acetylase RimI-like enzyme